MKLLITDGMFPNKYTTWRNYAILELINKFDTSILVKHGKSWAGIDYEVDFKYKAFKNILNDEYRFLIFDPHYNSLNKYNKNFDGTKFNINTPHYSYLLTKEEKFKIEEYDAIYHIFLGCYLDFNINFSFPKSKQLIHMYAGGGFNNVNQDLSDIDNDTHVISTHPLTSKRLSNMNINFIDCWTTPLFEKNEESYLPGRNSSRLNVCFASMGHGKEKGDRKFVWIARLYRLRYPRSKVRFVSIGNCKKSRFIKNFGPMAFDELELFYRSNIDIYVNTSTKFAFNGWPLGLESMKNGCLMLTTDVNKVSNLYEAEKYSIYPVEKIREFIKEIRKYDLSHDLFFDHAKKHGEFVQHYAGYPNQQFKIINKLKTMVNLTKM